MCPICPKCGQDVGSLPTTTHMSAHPPRPDTNQPSARNRPTKHFRLTVWRLLYHVDVVKSLDRQDEIDACRHGRLDLAKWDEEKTRCPKQWTKLLAKRQRRLSWFKEYGSVPDGWTPPDPKDPLRTSHRPVHAYLARRGLTFDEFVSRYGLIPTWRKKGRRQPNWKLILKIVEWTES
jgi:hypothetical protein